MVLAGSGTGRYSWNPYTSQSDTGFRRMGSIRRASAALKSKFVRRTHSWGSADCIAEEGYTTVILAERHRKVFECLLNIHTLQLRSH